MTEANGTIVKLSGVHKVFYKGKESVVVFENLDFEVPEGQFLALMGPSGSGKTTLLNLIAGLDSPTQGSVVVAGSELGGLSETEKAKFRARTIGFVFQSFNLLPVLTASQNVELALLLTGLPRAERKKRAETALRLVGLEGRMDHYPRQLSGGQEQRVAIARAIVNDPRIVIADEPTGDLDRKSADEVLDLMQKLSSEFKKTIIMVSHDPRATERAQVTRHLDKGTFA